MRFTISRKLYAGFAAVLAVMLVVSAVAFNGVQSLQENAGWVDHTHNVLNGLDEIVSNIKDAETGQRGFLITGEDRYLEPYNFGSAEVQGSIDHVAFLTSDNAVQQERIAELQGWVDAKLAELAETIELRRVEGFEAARTVVLTDAGKESADNIRAIIDTMTAEEASLLIVRDADAAASTQLVKTAVLAGGLIALIVTVAVAYFLSRAIAGGIGKVSAGLQSIAGGDLNHEVSINSADELGEMSGAYNEMQQYLDGMAKAADGIAGGDLTVEVTPMSDRDALGTSFVTMLDMLRNAIGGASEAATKLGEAKEQLAGIAEQAATATQEIAKTTGEVAEGTSQQASSTQDVNTGVSDLNQAIAKIVEGAQTQAESIQQANTVGNDVASRAEEMATNASQAAGQAREAAEKATQGAELVEGTVAGMQRIKGAVEAAAEQIGVLGERSAEIGKIVAVIDDIAAQTNLLALNAAIEAARAGEQGRGFAVVADEVRQLAERVVGATKEIAELIGGVQQGVDDSVKAMEEGASETDAGNQSAAEAGQALGEILAAATAVTEQIEELATGSEQLKSSGQEMTQLLEDVSSVVEDSRTASVQMQETAESVGQSVSNIASIAEENSAATEEASAGAEEMTAQVEEVTASTHALGELADELQEQISLFQLDKTPRSLRPVALPSDQGEGEAAA